jgi:hypothetical protein
MPKPDTIDRHQCHGREKEEKYKDLTALDYWWGLRELAADFDVDNYLTKSGDELSIDQRNDLAYIQLLHYTVEVKLAGVYFQMEIMEKLFNSPIDENFIIDLRVFEAKEAFDALNEDMYQATCATANQLFAILNRPYYKLIKADQAKRVAMSPSELRYWLKLNQHPDFKSLSAMLNDCDNQLDIRHHATHFGAVPVFADVYTGVLYVQKNFRIGELLTKYDVLAYKKSGKPMANLVEASKPRARSLCAFINRIYKYIWRTNTFESYMESRGVKIKEGVKPYWERSA